MGKMSNFRPFLGPIRVSGMLRIMLGVVLSVGALRAIDAAERPHIILIMVDDLGYEGVSAYGSTSYQTPTLDGLAKQGVLFNHCYSTPICTPSRVQIMTGKYNFRNYIKFGYLDPKQKTFANVLKQAGYQTAIAGKWQLGGDASTVHGFGFETYSLWHLNGRDSRYWEPRIETNGQLRKDVAKRFGPDVMCDFVVDTIQNRKEKPLFIYWPMCSPHWPFVPTPDSPMGGSRERLGKYDGKQGGTEYFDDMVNYLDKLVGRVVKTLDSEGIRDNTLILFTCDNGCATNIRSVMKDREIVGGKASLPDAGTHVSLVANWPSKMKGGRVVDELVDFTDFLPTLADAAQTELPVKSKIDGQSFLPLLLGEKYQPREWIFCHYIRNGTKKKPAKATEVQKVLKQQGLAKEKKLMGRFARNQTYKLYEDGRFYNVGNDVLEKKPLAANDDTTGQAKIRKMLQGVHDSMPAWQPFKLTRKPMEAGKND